MSVDSISQAILTAFEVARREQMAVLHRAEDNKIFLTAAQINHLTGVSTSAIASRLHHMLMNPGDIELAPEGVTASRDASPHGPNILGAWG